MRVAFVGLGAMGAPMAANLTRVAETLVFNRTVEVARRHADEHGSIAVSQLSELGGADVVCSCLPTDREVALLAEQLAPHLREGTVWVDHTSGDPVGSRRIAQMLAEHGVRYLDAPVSGGTEGAAAGTLTTMVGGEPDALEAARPALEAVATNIVHVGGVGAGMAVKAANQMLLASNLVMAAEMLVALAKAGVDATVACEVINNATGRSFATQRLIPERVLTRAFPRTFALNLLDKDVGIAASLADELEMDAPLLEQVAAIVADASRQLGEAADHVEIVRVVEQREGVQLR